ncbi:hypothetical protein N8083_00400 [Candidatus Pacebacteria bacterium]|nr:hypothetical protein [Candidatus Paceibacterota bacterium]
MNSLFAFSLTSHVILGIIGVIGSYTVLLFLLKSAPPLRTLKIASTTACISYILSWFSGGYYYVFYYGSQVKPGIKEGAYPWAHLVFMEVKEHIFIFLPFATAALAVAIFTTGSRLETDSKLKNSLVLASAVITIVATIITLSGILITGGAR